ncbi:MAG: RHS repeat domain-containing protein [Gammaproteobacteria bacterium]
MPNRKEIQMNHGMMRFIATLFLACLSLMAQGVEVVTYYHNDALGSPIIATDQQGRVVWRKSYAPYGQPIGQTAPNEPGYTGKFEEPDLGIQNFGARWYDPRIGRFLAIDPAGFDPQNPQSFNRYAYGNNNPYKYVDPDGRVLVDTIWDFGNVVYDVANGNWGDAAIDAGAMLIPFVPAGISKLRHVDDAAEAVGVVAKPAIKNTDVYRQGTFADETVGWEGNFVKGKQWANDNPLTTPDYAKKYGLPAENTGKPDWVVKGRVKGNSTTRPAPASHNSPANTGGGTEVLPAKPDDVTLDWFHMPD